MKALVTGATGFIGQHLVRSLLKEGWSVRCLARKTSHKPDEFKDSVEWVIGDLQDRGSLTNACSGMDLIFHLAGAIKARHPKDFQLINGDGTANVVSAVLESCGNARLVYVSSLSVGGPSSRLLLKTEEEPAFPVSAYGHSKLAGEIAVLQHREELHSVIIRPAVVYGPGDKETFTFFKLARFHINPHLGFKKRFVSIIHVEDLVRLLILSAKGDLDSGEVFYASDRSNGYSWNDIIIEAAKALDKWTIPVFVPKFKLFLAAYLTAFWGKITGKLSIFSPDKYREMKCSYWTCSSRKAERMLGFDPEYDLERGITYTATWYKENGWL